MSDRLAVLHAGKVVQVGTPSEVYSQPATSYVATFLGTTNLFSATVTAVDADALTCTVGDTTLSVSRADHAPTVGDDVEPDGPPRTRRDHPLRRHLGPATPSAPTSSPARSSPSPSAAPTPASSSTAPASASRPKSPTSAANPRTGSPPAPPSAPRSPLPPCGCW